MKIEILKTKPKLNLFKDIQNRFGETAVILNRIEEKDQEYYFICHDAKDFKSNISRNSASAENKFVNKISQSNSENIFTFYLKSFLETKPLNSAFKNLILKSLVEPSSLDDLLLQIKVTIDQNLNAPKELNLNASVFYIYSEKNTNVRNIISQIHNRISSETNKNVFAYHLANDFLSDIPGIYNPSKLKSKDIYSRYHFDLNNAVYILNVNDMDSLDSNSVFQKKAFKCHIAVCDSLSSFSYFDYLNSLAKWDNYIFTNISPTFFTIELLQFLILFKPYLSIGSLYNDSSNNLIYLSKDYFIDGFIQLIRKYFTYTKNSFNEK